RYHASVLCSPNFGYRHYLKVLGDRPLDGIDLSAVRVLFNGAEPISVELCEEFLTRLAPTGLARNSMLPVYGLAEASLAVSFAKLGAPMRTISLDRHALGVGEAARPVPANDRSALSLVSVGQTIPYCRLRIAADDDAQLADGRIGNI